MINFSNDIFFKISKINSEFLLSKFPVGSSSNNISVFLASALPMASLCFSPPERRLTFESILSVKPINSRISLTLESSLKPDNLIFSRTSKSSIRLYSWKTKEI